MSITSLIFRIQRINDLIKRQATGNPREFAEKLEISESRLYEILRELRYLGLPIKFSHLSNSYFYDGEAEVIIRIKGRSIKQIKN